MDIVDKAQDIVDGEIVLVYFKVEMPKEDAINGAELEVIAKDTMINTENVTDYIHTLEVENEDLKEENRFLKEDLRFFKDVIRKLVNTDKTKWGD